MLKKWQASFKFLALLFLLPCSMWAQSPKALTTSQCFQDPQANCIANGTLILDLNQPTTITGLGGLVAPIRVIFQLTAGGMLPAGSTIWANDQMTPSGTAYLAMVENSNGLVVSNLRNCPWVIAGTAPIDLSMMTCTNIAASYPTFSGLTGPAGPAGPTGATGPAGTISATSGPSPWTDVTAYGARAVNYNSGYSTTATCNGTTSVTLAAASVFQNGDGISLYGCGVTAVLSTPSAPTVTSGNSSGPTNTGMVTASAPSGCATSRSYTIRALGAYSLTAASNHWGECTSASTAGTTTTSCATLGPNNVTITSIGASDSSGNRTITCAATCALAVGAWVETSGTSDDKHTGGHFYVSTITDTTHVKVTTALLSDSNTSTGGTLYWYNEDKIACPTGVSNVFQYAIYDHGTTNLIGMCVPGVAFFDYYGTTMSGNFHGYPWLASTDAGGAVNAVLTTTVVSGAGTTSIVVANAASNSTSGTYATFDDVPLLNSASATAVNNGSPLYIPPTAFPTASYIIGSYWVSHLNGGFYPPKIMQAGQLYVDAPIQWDNSTGWYGQPEAQRNSTSQQALLAPSVICNFASVPCFYGNSADTLDVSRIFISTTTNAQNGVTLAYLNGGSLAFFDGVTFDTSSNGDDYTSIGLFNNGDPGMTLNNPAFLAGDPQTAGTSQTPMLLLMGTSGQNKITGGQTNFNRRCVASVLNNTQLLVKEGAWVQGPITPFYTIAGTANVAIGGIELDSINMDTSAQAIFAEAYSIPFNSVITLRDDGGNTWITGSGVQGVIASQELLAPNGTFIPGQNFGYMVFGNSSHAPDILFTSQLSSSVIAATGTLSVTGTGACATITTTSGGAWAGKLTCTGTTGASTLVINPGITATNGFSCFASDLTTAANTLRQSATGTGTCTIAGTVNANDVLTFGAIAY